MPASDRSGYSEVAIVTGAGSGTGRAVAEESVLAGHSVLARKGRPADVRTVGAALVSTQLGIADLLQIAVPTTPNEETR